METDLQGTVDAFLSPSLLTAQALQLLEFLIKNGSERVIDDARSHVSLLKMLRQFHFIDSNGKDQGINVRNRAKELADLLSDVERIRTERKKARANRNKFGGVEGGAGVGIGGFSGSGGFSGGSGSGGGGGGSRYGGYGSEQADYGGYKGEVYGDGGGFGGNQSGFADTQQRRDRFDEYDEYDEGESASPAPARRKEPATSHARKEVKKEEPKPKAPEPVVDLLAWDDEPAPASISAGKQPVTATSNDFGDDDDFDDFQSAAPAAPVAKPAPSAFNMAPPASTSTISASTQFAAPQAQSAAQNNSFNSLLATVSPPPAANKMSAPPAMTSSFSKPPQPSGYQASGPNYFTSVPQPAPKSGASTPSVMSPGGKMGGSAAPKKAGGDAFASLLGGVAPKKSSTPTQKVTMGDLAKQKTSQGLWGAPASSSSTPAAQTPQSGSKPGGALGDLLG
jgi:epsin